MSSPHSNHSDSNYPEDGVSHYPKSKGKLKKMAKKTKLFKGSESGMDSVNKSIDRKNHRRRQIVGEAGSHGYRPYRRE